MMNDIKDTLKREDEASTLLKILLSEQKRRVEYGESLVVSLAAPWGYGKTTFLKLLEREAGQSQFVFYFDAWANDHSNDALTSFLAEFQIAFETFAEEHDLELKDGESKDKSILGKGKIVFKAAVPLIAGHIMKRAVGISIDEYKELADSDDGDADVKASVPSSEGAGDSKYSEDEVAAAAIGGKVATKLAEGAVKSHAKAKAARSALVAAIHNLNNAIEGVENYSTPIIILIDELDRCRPNYAIELLETMKHFFNAPGVVYIVANNTDELGHSIKALYGNDFDSAGYLKRFFDFQYRLKEPNTRLFCEALSSEFNLNSDGRFISPLNYIHDAKAQRSEISEDIAAWHLKLAMNVFNLSLRDISQIALRTNLIGTVAQRQLDLFVLLLMVSADHKESGSHRRMFFGERDNWVKRNVPVVVDESFPDRYPQRSGGMHQTRVSEIFSFYADAGELLVKHPHYEHLPEISTLNKRVLDIVCDRSSSDGPIVEDYVALVERLNNLTM